MKPELDVDFTNLMAQFSSWRDRVWPYIPEDPSVPTGLAFIDQTNPAILLLTWDDLPSGQVAILEAAGVDLNTNEPGGWTPCGIYLTKDSQTGAWATFVLPSSSPYRLLFRLSVQRVVDGVTTLPCEPIQYDSPS